MSRAEAGRRRAWFGVVFAVAFAARAVAVRRIGADADVVQMSLKPLDMARNLLLGNGLSVDTGAMNSYDARVKAAGRLLPYDPEPSWVPTPEFHQDTGLALVFAGLWRATGSRDPVLLSWLHALLDSFCAVLVLRAGTRLFSFRAGVLAGLAYALFPPQIAEVARPCFYVWPVFAGVLGLALLAEVDGEDRGWRRDALLFALTGLGLGAIHWVRSVVALYSLALAGGVAIRTRSARRTALALVLLVGVHALAIVPLSVRNHRLFGTWRPTRGNFWHMFWIGIGQYDNPYGCINEDAAATRFIEAKYHVNGDSPEYQERIRDEVVAIAKKDPWLFVRNFARRLLRLTPFGEGTGLRYWPIPFDPPFLVLWPLGLAFAWRRRAWVPVVVPLAYFVFTVTPYYYMSHYVLPGLVALLVPIAALATDLEHPVLLPAPAPERRRSLALWTLAFTGPMTVWTVERVLHLGDAHPLGLAAQAAFGLVLGRAALSRGQAVALGATLVLMRPSPWHAGLALAGWLAGEAWASWARRAAVSPE